MEATTHYQARVEALRAAVGRQLAAQPLTDATQLPADFLYCRASQRHYLPAHTASAEAFYEQVLLHRSWAGLDELQEQVYFLTQCTGDTSFLADIAARPRIFCTFHLGSYRMIHHYLWRHRVDFTLVIDSTTYAQQGEKFRTGHDDNPAYRHSDFRLIDAEQRTSGVQMLRELRAGRSLLFYIDGNSGVGGMGRQDEKVALIEFMGRHIFARKGIAHIAHASGTPIVPLVAFRHADTNFELRFFPAIEPDAAQPRDTYAHATTQALFRLFEPVLHAYPEQWEGWLYLHHFAALHAAAGAAELPTFDPAQAADLAFNDARYTLFWSKGEPHLFDDDTYQAFRISAQLAEVLSGLAYRSLGYKRSLAASSLFAELLRRRMVVVPETMRCLVESLTE